MLLPVLKYPHPGLKETSVPVLDFGPELHELLDNLRDTMRDLNGIGLAAPQVGKPVKAFVVELGGQLYEFINPELAEKAGRISFDEGCLSFPGILETVERPKFVTIRFQDRYAIKRTLEAQGLLAVAIQHEYDHLDGVLFIERMPFLRRFFAKRQYRRGRF
jgi:peptide deformylase